MVFYTFSYFIDNELIGFGEYLIVIFGEVIYDFLGYGYLVVFAGLCFKGEDVVSILQKEFY